MFIDPQWHQFLRQLHDHIEWQANKLSQLEKTIETLQTEFASLKEKKQIYIEKIEYNFDQLKIEKLDGTLNIGFTPNFPESIEEMAVNGMNKEEFLTSSQPDNYQQIRNHIQQFLTEEVPKKIQALETKYNNKLEDNYRELIIEDVKKQLDHRIHYYVNQMKSNVIDDHLSVSSAKDPIVEKLKNDIEVAIDTHLRNLPKKESELQ